MKKPRSWFVTKIVIVVLFVYLSVSLVSLQIKINDAERANEILSNELAIKSQENQKTGDIINSELTDYSVIQIAREKLGMVFANEKVFVDMSN